MQSTADDNVPTQQQGTKRRSRRRGQQASETINGSAKASAADESTLAPASDADIVGQGVKAGFLKEDLEAAIEEMFVNQLAIDFKSVTTFIKAKRNVSLN